MAASRATRIAMGLMVAAIAVLVFLLVRGSSSDDAAPAAKTGDGAERGPGGPAGFATGGGTRGKGPPVVRRNEIGQPLNEDGRPIGPPDKLAKIRNEPLVEGELPLVPPVFDDPAERARFKKWWVDELGRRVSVYEDLEPRDEGYPTEEQTETFLEEYYDSAEPRGPDESVEDAYERRKAWRVLWQRWLDDYGDTLQTISSRGGDPQHGATPPPPVTPPGIPDPDPEPAPESDTPPPGRGSDDPAGTAPIEDGREGR